MTRIPASGRLPVEDSLFDRLREVDPGIATLSVTKSTLVATSHLIETLVYEHGQRCVLVSGFQHGRHWAGERDRYLQLSGDHDVIALFAGRELPAGSGVDHVGLRLRTGDPLAQEWFVLAVGPGLAVTLCGLDGDAHSAAQAPVRQAERVFDVVWSLDPQVAAVAAQVVVAGVRRTAPERAEEVAALLAEAGRRPPSPVEAARASDALLAGMVRRVEAVGRREQQVLAAASQEKSVFLSRMSHELRTPLNAILGFAQLLELDAEQPEAQESVEQILRAGRGMVGLVDELLDIGRIEAGGLNLDLQPVPVGPLVAGVVSMMSPLVASASLVLRDRVEQPGPRVRADEARLRQVLLNLLSNAVKYTPAGGQVEVGVTRTPDAVRLSVSDTGPGLSVGELERLFTPFERLGAAQRGIPGNGLGLVVSRALVQAMGGQLEVDSRPGAGSTFTVALPAAATGMDADAEPVGDAEPEDDAEPRVRT
ncbi:ATP-binding protein [Aquipuribacter hungaricus]|uniref:ATP-binding protein n=1 Tax=Aquipuribacter hungaricus TaxID=545624 RepID=UPI0030EE7F74